LSVFTRIEEMKLLIIAISLLLLAQLANAEHGEYQQKMIRVEGENSYLMKGDPYKNNRNKPLNYKRDAVLPSLLSAGWKIVSVEVNEKSTEDLLYGYVVLERHVN